MPVVNPPNVSNTLESKREAGAHQISDARRDVLQELFVCDPILVLVRAGFAGEELRPNFVEVDQSLSECSPFRLVLRNGVITTLACVL